MKSNDRTESNRSNLGYTLAKLGAVCLLTGFMGYQLGLSMREEYKMQQMREVQKERIQKAQRDPRYRIYKTINEAKRSIEEWVGKQLAHDLSFKVLN